MKRLITALSSLGLLTLTCTVLAFPPSNAGLARSTVQVKAPNNPVDVNGCLACHQTVNSLMMKGNHAKLNCASCHDVTPEHAKAPSAMNRPTTRTSHATCAQCHPNELEDMMNTKYHMAWAKNHDRQSYNYVNDANLSQKDIQRRVPRFHIGLLADIAVNRMGGRFAYKNRSDEGRPTLNLWEKVYDTKPEMGDELKLEKPSLAWRPQKNVGLANFAACMRCKSADNHMDWAYLGDPYVGAPLNFKSTALPSFKKLNSGTGCIYCHDPHAAKPRVIVDYLLEAMIEPQYKDNEFQKRTGQTLAKVEVVEMGVRGYKRKIGLLDRYDSNLMCGQCHISYNALAGLKTENGEPYAEKGVPKLTTTLFPDGPLAAADWYEKKGLWNAIHPLTGTKYVSIPTHGHVETLVISKHGEAGVGCADCHFAKKENGTKEHQFSLPMAKIQNTCMRSECHGPGSSFNWKDVSEAKYQINLLQQRAHNRFNHWQQAHNNVLNYLADVKRGNVKISDEATKKLHRTFARSMTGIIWWTTDYSDGIHNLDLLERDAITITGELNSVLKEAKMTEAK